MDMLQVAKESADVIILDDNFKTIVNVARWGRSVYINIQKFVQFQLTVNVVALIINFVCACVSGLLRSRFFLYEIPLYLFGGELTRNNDKFHISFRICSPYSGATALGEHDYGHSWCFGTGNRASK